MKVRFNTLVRYFSCLLIVVCWGCQTTRVVDKKPLPPKDSDLFGVWAGLAEDGLNYFRIDLQPDGTGLCAYVYLHDEAKLLAVEKWSAQSSRIEITLCPIDDDRNQITKIIGIAHATVMELTVFGKGWQCPLVIRREDDMERRANHVKNRMILHKAEAGTSTRSVDNRVAR